jgi:hypothetical protein
MRSVSPFLNGKTSSPKFVFIRAVADGDSIALDNGLGDLRSVAWAIEFPY